MLHLAFMKQAKSATGSLLLPILWGAAVCLVLFSTYLYKNNQSVKQHNRELIIQNDSIISVNIELRQELERREGKLAKTKKIADR